MPGIEDVDRQFRRRIIPTAPTDGELAAERGVREDCAAAAAAIGDKVEEVPLFAAGDEAKERETGRAYFERYLAEHGLLSGPALVDRVQPISQGTLDALDAADRREVRRQALELAASVGPLGAPESLDTVIAVARAFERYLLGEGDPPKPPAKME